MHDLTVLPQRLKTAHLQIHLKTSGAASFSCSFDWVTFSPRFKPPHLRIYPHVSELKVVVADESDLEWAEQQIAQVPPTAAKLLQPEWETPDSQGIVFS